MKMEETRFAWGQTGVLITAVTHNGLNAQVMKQVVDNFGPLFTDRYNLTAIQIAISVTQLPGLKNSQSFFATAITTPLVEESIFIHANHVDPSLAIISALGFWLNILDHIIQLTGEVIENQEQGKELPEGTDYKNGDEGEKVIISIETIMEDAYRELNEAIEDDIKRLMKEDQLVEPGEIEETDPLLQENINYEMETALPERVDVDKLLSEAFQKKPRNSTKNPEDRL
ncbi:MAG: hypothetical protein WC473_04795 [Patescibacteria group bacterium]